MNFFTFLVILFLSITTRSLSAQNVNVNPGAGSYPTLKDAFDAINAGTHTGVITIQIVGNTTETLSAVLNASGAGSASYTSISIIPSGGLMRSINGSIAGPLVDLNGANNVTIDGLNSGGNSLTIDNQNTGVAPTSTLRFINDASSNTIQNTTILGASTAVATGTIFFSTSGGGTGNDNNLINNSTIDASTTGSAVNGILNIGTVTAGQENSSNTISNSNVSNFFSATLLSSGILIGAGATNWTISGNKLYQSTARTYTTANIHNGISVQSGNAHNISDNIIGYSSVSGTGTYTMMGTIATRFIGINLAVGTTTATTVNGNVVTAFSLATSSGAATTNGILCGINVTSGNVNIGTITGNTIGASTGVASLAATPTSTGGVIVGINTSSTGAITIQNNIIGAFQCIGSTPAVAGSVIGINISGVASSLTISNNTIGNSTADNMQGGNLGTTTGATIAIGINMPSVPLTPTISNNTIQNFSSFGSGTGNVRGIFTSTTSSAIATYTISNNTISNLKTNSSLVGASSGLTAAAGIQYFPGVNSVISGNIISNIQGLNTGLLNTVITGISAAQATTPMYSSNRIFDITNASTATSATAPGVAAGFTIRSGTTDITIVNNMISLGSSQNTNTSFIGIWANHGSTPNPIDNIYFNSVNITGVAAAGAQPSFGFFRGDFTTTARVVPVDIRNNIFTNNRSGGTGAHFAIANDFGATVSATGWGMNASTYNVLNAAVSTVGWWGGNQTFAGWQTASNGDANSFSGITVTYINPANDLHLNMGLTPTVIESGAIPIPGITTDYDNQVRPGPGGSINGGAVFPDIGADEFDGVPLDLSPPLITYTPLTNSICTNSYSFTATIADVTGVNTSMGTRPRVWFKKSTENNVLPPTNTSADDGWKYAEATNTSSPFTFIIDYNLLSSPIMPGDVIQYFVVAQDLSMPPNVGTNIATYPVGFTPASVALAPGAFPVTGVNSYTILANPVSINTMASPNSICISGDVQLSLTGDPVTGAQYQWQSSPTGLNTWNNIPGATTTPYTVVAVTSSTDYRAIISCGGTPISASPSTLATVTVSSPMVLTTTPGTECGPGPVSVTLGATGSPGATLNWYDVSTGGIILGSGPSFNTPPISTTTTYYVDAGESGGSASVGLPAALPTATSGAGTTNFGLVFDVFAPFTLNTVVVYAIAATPGTPGTVTIDVVDGSGAILHSQLVNVTGNPVASAVGEVVTLNFNIVPGTNLKLRPGSRTGITGLLFEPSASAPGGNYGYPFTVPGVLSITASTLTAPPANTPRLDLYYYFYNWQISYGCTTPRVPVVATITNDPPVCPANQSVCINAPAFALTGATPAGGVYSGPGVSGGMFNPAAAGFGTHTITYTICSLTCTFTITVNSLSVAPISIAETSGTTNNDGIICAGASATLTATGGGTYAWSTGATTPDITVTPAGTTTYTVTVTDAGMCTGTSSATITVNPLPTPIITATPGTMVCSPQTITLDAGPGYSSYMWTGGGTSQSIVVSMSGTYGVTVTDANGCAGFNSSTVTINPPPTLSETHVDPSDCFTNNGSIDLMVTPAGSYSYNWSTSNGSGLINGQEDQSGLSIGTYNVTVTNNAGGCTATQVIVLNVPGGCGTCSPVQSVSVFPTLICPGDAAIFTAIGPTQGATLTWWDMATGGTQVGTGNPFGSPPLFTTTTYCVQQDITISNDISFAYTGMEQTFVVPAGVNQISITTFGAQGGNVHGGGGGLGGSSTGTLNVIPGQTLFINVGGQGGTPAAGFNGGGPGGGNGVPAGGGGGASDVRVGGNALVNRTIVAGGGGGAAQKFIGSSSNSGGFGGGFDGGAGTNTTGAFGGGFGTQLAGGTGGAGGGGGADGTSGSLGLGGNGGNDFNFFVSGGGGGGGYYGGGGGEAGDDSNIGGGGGGGGSSYTGGVFNSTTTTNVRSGNGLILLSFNGPCSSTRVCGTVIVDNTPPAINCPASVTVQCAGQVPSVNIQSVTATDNSGGTPTITFVNDVTSNQSCVNRFTVVRTYRATDACGNSASCSHTITVFDNIGPVIACPAPLTFQCASQVPTATPGSITATDNCGGGATISFGGDQIVNQTCANRFTILRNYTAIDACGNTSTCIQTITVFDNTPPTLICPGNTTVQCASLIPPVNLNLVAVDNCGGTPPVITFVSDVNSNQTCANRFTVTRTYRATDACGNSAICTQLITVFDNTPPTFTCPANLTVACVGDVPAANLNLIATDNCDGPAPVITVASNITTNQTCANRFILNRIYRATDACGNSATCAQIITVFDNVAPTITITDPLFAGIPNNGTLEVQCYGQDPNWDPPTFSQASASATDNCGGTVTITYNHTFINGGDCIHDGYINRYRLTWTATDACGNSSSRVAFVNLVDEIPPVIQGVPANITVNCDEIPDPPQNITTADECLCACVITYHQSTPLPGCQNGQVIVRTWTATDDCGNQTIATQTIMLKDGEGPELQIIQPELAGLPNGSVLDYTCEEGGIPSFFNNLGTQSVTALNSCGGPVIIKFGSTNFETRNCGFYGYLQQKTFTWTAVDPCGNITTMTITAQLIDNEPPVLVGVPSMTCIGDPALNSIEAIDNCDHGTFTYSDKTIPNPCGTGTAIRRTYRASDQCDNVSEATAILIPNDGQGPTMVFTNPALANLGPGEILVADCSADFGVTDVSVDDRCPGTEITFDDRVSLNANCSENGVISSHQMTWTATDLCGNNSTLSVLVIVVDHTPPVFANHASEITIGCHDPLPVNTATDNCGSVVMTVRDSILDGPCIYEYDILRHLTATDPCGNSTSLTQTIHVGDGSGPIISGVEDVVCDDLSTPNVTAWDPCAEQNVPVNMTQEILDIPCHDGTIIERTWTATSVCGHVTTVTQTFILDDNTPPEIQIPTYSVILKFLDNPDHSNLVFLSQSDIIKSLNDLDAGSISFFDDCGEEIKPEFTLDVSYSENCAVDGYFERRTYTWVAEDACGNAAIISFTIDIMDDIPPVFSGVPEDATITCQPLPSIPSVQTEDPAQPVTVVYSEQIINGSGPGEFDVTRTWTATDACGNSSSAMQHIIWIPNTLLDCGILLPELVECNSHNVAIGSVVSGGLGELTYKWEVEGEKCFIESGQGTPGISIYLGFTEVTLILTVTDAFGCSTICSAALDCIDPVSNPFIGLPVTSDATRMNIGVHRIVESNADTKGRGQQFNLWPNPANESVNLNFTSLVNQEVKYRLINFLGQVMLRDKTNARKGANTQKVDLSKIPEGSYLMEIRTEKEMYAKVIVVMRHN